VISTVYALAFLLDGGWMKIPKEIVGRNSDFGYFYAVCPYFSSFGV
jgi:hypothetical protein